jgi:NAD(P)-dependent dehydrogenase (short-subunit alcohol dehydrogenase family)
LRKNFVAVRDAYMGRLQGKVAFITGGNSGIGRDTALLFAQEGAKVALAARREEEGELVAKEIQAAGGNAIFIKTDVTKAEDCRNAIARTVSTFGKLDISFNNAGVERFGQTVAELSEEDWNLVLDVNLKGVFLSMKYEIPELLKTGGGTIINMSSMYGLVGTGFGLAAYHASKHGVIGLTKAAALEFAAKKIRVNAVCPGVTTTDMVNRWLESSGLSKPLTALHPIGRFGVPSETAQAVLFLASEASSYITGAALPIDGGYTVG